MLAVIDCRLPLPCRAALCARGFTLVPLPPFPALAAPVASHPDMLILRFGDKLFCHRAYATIAKQAIDTILWQTGFSLVLTDDAVSPVYPHDVSFNFINLGNRILGKPDAMSGAVKEYATAQGIPVIPVKQGYAKCASVVLGERALITADAGIARAAESAETDTLLVSSGFVELPGYSEGFIGGASGVWQNTVFFCGNIDSHPECEIIRCFCQKHGFSVVSLSEEPLFDAGTLFFF